MNKRAKTPKEREPAYTSYFFSPIYKSVWNIVVSVYKNVKTFIFSTFFGKWMSALKGNFFLWPVLIVGAALGIITFVFTYVIITGLLLSFCACAVLIDGLVVGFCGLLRFADMLVRRINGIWTVCYNSDCQSKIVNAIYICPSCGVAHKKLYPGKYGILRRRCRCGQVIATTFFNGRRKLTAHCPYCNTVCQSDTIQISIPVFGGPSGGKTHIINSGLDELRKFAEKNSSIYDFEYWMDGDKGKHEMCMSVLNQRPYLDKTSVDRFDAYKFYFVNRKSAFKNLVYMFDIAGEAVVDQRRLESNVAMRYCKSFVFVLDPLSLPDFALRFQSENGKKSEYNPSDSYIEDIISAVLNTLQSTLGMSEFALKNANVAIVISKGDIPQVQEELGDDRVRECIARNEGFGYNKAVNQLCENFLEKYQATNFLDLIRMTFKSYQFFVANTWDSQKKKYDPHNTADPFLWLIDMESKHIDLKDRWNRTI